MGMGSHASKISTDCKIDVDVPTLDGTFQVQTSNVLNSLVAGAGSFNSRQEISECLMEMNQEPEVVKVIHDCKNEIWKKLFEDYFENSQETLNFCAALEKCLKSATDSYSKTLEELKSLENTSIYSQQTAMLERLQSKKSELDKKIKSIQSWQKVSSKIFILTFSAVLICSVVAVVTAAHPVAAAMAVATSIPVGSMGKWIDNLFIDNEKAARGQREVINSMIAATFVTVTDLDITKVLLDKLLETEIESLLISSDFSPETKAAFMNYVDKLGVQADTCIRNIWRAKPVILKRIIKHPNCSG